MSRRAERMQGPTFREKYERVYSEIRLIDFVARSLDHTQESNRNEQAPR
jgi:hypothetical protein